MFIIPLYNLSQCSQRLPKAAIILPQVRKLSKNEYYESQGHTLPNGRAHSLQAKSSPLCYTPTDNSCTKAMWPPAITCLLSLTFPICKMGVTLSTTSQGCADPKLLQMNRLGPHLAYSK